MIRPLAAAPLVLIPGHMCDARLWGPQVAALSGRRTIHLAEIAGAESVDGVTFARALEPITWREPTT